MFESIRRWFLLAAWAREEGWIGTLLSLFLMDCRRPTAVHA